MARLKAVNELAHTFGSFGFDRFQVASHEGRLAQIGSGGGGRGGVWPSAVLLAAGEGWLSRGAALRQHHAGRHGTKVEFRRYV